MLYCVIGIILIVYNEFECLYCLVVVGVAVAADVGGSISASVVFD